MLRSILMKLPVDSCCTMAEVSTQFALLLEEKKFWAVLNLVSDEMFCNKVCHYVLCHCSKVLHLHIDNVSSSEADFVVSWTDVLMSAMHNVRSVCVERSTFLSSGLFITHMPLVSELILNSYPSLCVFSLMQGFQCAQPACLKTLILTGVPGLDEQSVVLIATSCARLEKLDISGAWGPYLCLPCAHKIIGTCTKLTWFDFVARKPSRNGWKQLLMWHGSCQNRKVRFGPFISAHVGVDPDTE